MSEGCGVRQLLGTRLVHLLNDLKRQNDIGHFVTFAVPNQLHFALVVEQQEAVFIGQGLTLFDQFYDLVLFVVSEVHHFPIIRQG
ncbi:MAG: hypothetical protein QY324_07970 [Anaerolineales bacterium]|nr:MAG: hypothetical protein QY324_07970 [Anaerolineales bacterium]